jgi:hypothetical protein
MVHAILVIFALERLPQWDVRAAKHRQGRPRRRLGLIMVVTFSMLLVPENPSLVPTHTHVRGKMR